MLNIAICDDNEFICSELKEIILNYSKINLVDIEIDVFMNGESLVKFIESNKLGGRIPIDLIFLDIELGGITGVDVGGIIRNLFCDNVCKIVFISGSNDYDRQLFDFQPLNFLEKPIDEKKVNACINLAIKLLSIDSPCFEYQLKNEIVRLEYKNILYFESVLKKVKIVMINGEIDYYGSIDKTKDELPNIFISPHRSYIINFSNIKSIQNDSITMINDATIPISRRNLKAIRTLQIELEREKF